MNYWRPRSKRELIHALKLSYPGFVVGKRGTKELWAIFYKHRRGYDQRIR